MTNKKFWFLPSFGGILLIVFLNCLFPILYNSVETKHKMPTIYSFNLPSLNNKKNHSENWILNQSLYNKKIVRFDLTGVKSEDEKIFEVIQWQARLLKYSNDSFKIIQVHFTNENTYGDFLTLIKMMKEDFHKRYTYLQNDFYIFD